MPIELKPHACHKPRTPGCGPTRGLWSGVKDSGPQTVEEMPVCSTAGQRCTCPVMFWRKVSQSRSKSPNAKSDAGCAQNSGLVSYPPMAIALPCALRYTDRSWSRTFGSPPCIPSSGSVTTYACFIASSGSGAPAISDTAPAHAPHALTTWPVRMVWPQEVCTPTTRRPTVPVGLAYSSVTRPATRTPSRTVAPSLRAPLVYALTSPAGSSVPRELACSCRRHALPLPRALAGLRSVGRRVESAVHVVCPEERVHPGHLAR
mmetsp:Transcript_17784/g.56150  ORF Transcript_17784/g.56150 Transcript_17784/m.56150 type:complete len:261 (-) Transcript_17784:451-1233(-)